jgi:hypothetical protein
MVSSSLTSALSFPWRTSGPGQPVFGPDCGPRNIGERSVKHNIPSGKHTKTYGNTPFLMGISTINGHFQ